MADEIMDALSGAPTKRRRKVRGLEVVDGGKATFVAGVSYTDGRPDPCLHNATVLLRERHERAKWWVWDDFSGRLLVREPGKADRPLEEADELDVAAWLQSVWNTRFAVGVAQSALRRIAFAQRVDTLVEHVRRVKWDGVPRVDAFAARYLGVSDTAYHREVGRVLLLSAAARALRPGCECHTVVVLEGAQGCGKSSAVKALAGPFFVELNATLGTKDAGEQIEGAWVVELSELQALARAEATAIKQDVSKRSDRFRRAYARNVADVLRRCVFVGTTNAASYFRDETGGRRWLPIAVGAVDLAALRRDVAQLVAEAVHRVDAGEAWEVAEGVREEAAEAVADRYEHDPWEEACASFLAARQRVTVTDVLDHLRIEAAHRSGAHQSRAAKLLTFLGYRRVQVRNWPGGRSRTWVYERHDPVVTVVPVVTLDPLQKPALSPESPQSPVDRADTHMRARRGASGDLDLGGAGGDSGDSDGNAPRHEQTFAEWLEDAAGEGDGS